eukprot:20416-Heterococcus_DN1.PRE.6
MSHHRCNDCCYYLYCLYLLACFAMCSYEHTLVLCSRLHSYEHSASHSASIALLVLYHVPLQYLLCSVVNIEYKTGKSAAAAVAATATAALVYRM